MRNIFGAIVMITCLTTAAFASDWPTWHGVDRSNKSKETGLLKEWPKDGPKLLWTASGAGVGYSGVTVSGGMVYSAGTKNGGSFVFAFDKNGKLVWEKKISSAYRASWSFARAYEGARATPTVDGNMLYHLSDAGLFAALDTKTGALKWSVDLMEKYDGTAQPFGYTESPLVVGNMVIVSPYGPKVTVAAFDKITGKEIWTSFVDNSGKAYASHVLADHGGHRQLIAFTEANLYSISAANGEKFWTLPFRNARGHNCPDIVYHDGHVFASSGYGLGSMLVKLGVSGGKPTAAKVYETKLLDNHHGGVILHNGYVYGAGHESGKGLYCLDFKTGKQMWNVSNRSGALTFADGMLYLYGENGTMSLIRPAPDKFTEVSSFKVPEGGRGAYWAHPVVSHGVLYLRHADKIFAYDVKRK